MAQHGDHNKTGTHTGKIKFEQDGCTGQITVDCGECHGAKAPHKFYATGTFKNAIQRQADVINKAKLKADPDNGGDIRTAKEVLEGAGFEVYWA